MKAVELAVSQRDCWRNIAITLVDPASGVLSVIADLNLIVVFCVSVEEGLNFHFRRFVAGVVAAQAYPALLQKRK
jgi:hypothetical protein